VSRPRFRPRAPRWRYTPRYRRSRIRWRVARYYPVSAPPTTQCYPRTDESGYYLWQCGHYAWDPYSGYYWVEGRWIVNQAGYSYQPGYWYYSGGRYHWRDGNWVY
jgi:hypothetical protein